MIIISYNIFFIIIIYIMDSGITTSFNNNDILNTIKNMETKANTLNANLDTVQKQVEEINRLKNKFSKLKDDIKLLIDGIENINDIDCKKKLDELIRLLNGKIKDQKTLDEYKKTIRPIIETISTKLDDSLKKMDVSQLEKKLKDFESNMNSLDFSVPEQRGGFKKPKSSKKRSKKTHRSLISNLTKNKTKKNNKYAYYVKLV